MRILLVIDGMHPRDGGPPAVVAGSAIALKARRLDVTVLTTLIPGDDADVERTWASMTEAGVKLRYCAPVGLHHLVGLQAVDRTMADAIEAADVVHIHGFWTPALITTAKMARRTSTPYFISTHGLLDRRAMTSSKAKWVKKHLALAIFGFRPVFRDASGIIFGSETEDKESWDPVRDMRKLYIPNGVQVTVGQTPASPASRERLSVIAPQFDGWRLSLLFYSRIHPEKVWICW